MGAGRVIMTDIRRIDFSVETGEFFRNPAFVTALDNAKARGGAVHLMGLLSDGLVHSSQEHLYALIRMAKERGLRHAYVHCFLDGRDTPPSSAHLYVKALQERIAEIGFGEIATVCGRYYRGQTTRGAYEARLRHARRRLGRKASNTWRPSAALPQAYRRVSRPAVSPRRRLASRDEGTATLYFYNFRADRARQLTRAWR